MLRQGIRETSANPKYNVGQRYAEGDRVLRYSYAETALTEKWGAGNNDALHEQNSQGARTAGEKYIYVLLTGMAADELKGGYINVWTTPVQVALKIKGNTASDGTGTLIELEEPLLYAVPSGTFTDVHCNIYRHADVMAGGFMSVIGIPLVPVPAGHYFWAQTWGPVTGVAHAGGGIGENANERAVYFANDGSIGLQSDVVGTVDCQYAGYMLPNTASGNDIFFMLQLQP